MNFNEITIRSKKIRDAYHKLEIKNHGSEWTTEEDALAFLTDAGLIGRLIMSQQGRWLGDCDNKIKLEHKISECIWWLTVLAEQTDININDALEKFLAQKEHDIVRG